MNITISNTAKNRLVMLARAKGTLDYLMRVYRYSSSQQEPLDSTCIIESLQSEKLCTLINISVNFWNTQLLGTIAIHPGIRVGGGEQQDALKYNCHLIDHILVGTITKVWTSNLHKCT